MTKFIDTEQGKLTHYLIHEHNNGISTISMSMRGLEFRLDKGIPIEEDELRELISRVRAGIKRASDGVDYMYEKLKEKHDRLH